MRLSTGTALVASSLFSFVSAQGPYQYYLSYNTPAGEEITGLAGRFDIPRLLQAGGLFLWPGLEASDTSGELHAKLNGTTGSWTLSSDWCGDPTISPGPDLPATEGQSVIFNMTKQANNWSVFVNAAQTFHTDQRDYQVADKTFNSARFFIELQGGAAWTFGAWNFTNVVITSTGNDASWCTNTPENYQSKTTYSVTGVKPVVANGAVECNIQSLVLEHPTSA